MKLFTRIYFNCMSYRHSKTNRALSISCPVRIVLCPYRAMSIVLCPYHALSMVRDVSKSAVLKNFHF